MPKPIVTLRKPPKAEAPSLKAVEAFVHGNADNATSRNGDQSPAQQVAPVISRNADTATSRNRDKSTSQHAVRAEEFKRATYYLRPEQIRALQLRAVKADRNLSAEERDAIDAYLGG